MLNGKIITLEKPIVLLQKVRQKVQSFGELDEDEDQEKKMIIDDDSEKKKQKDEEVKFKTEYIVKAVVRKKILFNKRPRPIVFT